MPRLSIIVPHRHQDSRLEATLLSLLENRPDDSEIIVVHDGSYGDPYKLVDEVIFIEEERSSNTLKLLNAGVMAACSPAIWSAPAPAPCPPPKRRWRGRA